MADDQRQNTNNPPATGSGLPAAAGQTPPEAVAEAPTQPMTPPPELRTDADRGVGEMGAESLAPDQPLGDS